MSIPMVDLRAELPLVETAIRAGIDEVLKSGAFILGPITQALERDIAALCGTQHAVACASGTDALHLALRGLGIGPGDEVITTAFTFIGTAEAIAYVGATPVFVDVRADTFNIDPALVEAAITPRTRAIMPVHLYGRVCDMDALGEIARRRGLAIVEDCAQSIGSALAGRACGSFGAAGCFSFYPSKNLGAFGDAGMVTTDDDALADAMRALRNHGSRKQYHHDVIGYNSRLDEFQAVVLRAKLAHLADFNRARRAHAAGYSARLAGLPVVTPDLGPEGAHVFHQYTLRTPRRDALQAALKAAGIASAIYYPIALHRQAPFREACAALALPVTEQLCTEVLSLPMYPRLTDALLDEVCGAIRKFFGEPA
jgi:dTDP-4-amino-4,6-dideoxygalactose transaminase